MIHQIISQNTNYLDFQYRISEAISDVLYTGSYGGLVTPKCVFHKGDTYMTGTDDNTNRNPVLFRYRQSDDSVVGVDVGTIDNFDPLFHQHPSIFIKEDFIYIMMVNGHGQDIKIWKSNTTDIADGFTLFHTITGNFSYVDVYSKPNGSLYFLSRTLGGMNHQIGVSDTEDYTSWTVTQITNPDFSTTDNRHYPNIPIPYGNNDWFYFCINLRNETNTPTDTETYFGHAYYKTQDFETFYSLDETYSKNISIDGVFTPSEIETNLTYVGSTSDDRNYVGASWGCVINDEIYNAYYDSNISYWKFYKINALGVKTEFQCFIPNVQTTVNFSYNFSFYYNENNLIIRTSTRKFYTSDLSFNNQVEYFDITESSGEVLANATIPPYNFKDVSGKYLLGGATSSLGKFPYFITEDKFIR